MILELMLIGLGCQSNQINDLQEEVIALRKDIPYVPKLGFWAQIKADAIKEDTDIKNKKEEDSRILRNYVAGCAASHSNTFIKSN